MDQHEKDLLSNLGLQPGDEGETPIYGNNNSRIVDETLARFSSSWDTPPLSSMSREQVQGESTFRNMLSSPAKQSGSDEPTSSSSRMEEEDLLHVEKSRVLEMLRHMTSEVDQLESQLQAIKRKRARTAASAIQKQQEIQEAEAREMRQILGSVHQMSIVDSPKGRAGRLKINTPLSQTVSNVDVDMIRVLRGFTNIAFTSIEHRSISTLDPSGGGGRQYHIAGSCFQLDFDIEFTVHDPDLDLSNVRIHVPRSASAELGQFISRTLSQYAQMDYDRQVVMDNLAKRFPKLLKTNRIINKSVKARQSPNTKDATSPIGVSPAGPGVQSLTFCGARYHGFPCSICTLCKSDD
ncbi:hypothetical protein BGZ80_007274 [Entomortierella chlamydospora]|uniref:Uncharacterized protein n=1 Tax=Entomortierella chlamydospora TaxID=101097 RepID=A0A9P6N5B2_9FUNG|nr:hypothetical protein BGZ80_007274 [Entomortierella chlamydospora]